MKRLQEILNDYWKAYIKLANEDLSESDNYFYHKFMTAFYIASEMGYKVVQNEDDTWSVTD